MKKIGLVSLFLTGLLAFSFASASEKFRITEKENIYYGYPNPKVQEAKVWKQALEKCEKIGLLAVNIEKVEFITSNGSTGSPLYFTATGLFSCEYE